MRNIAYSISNIDDYSKFLAFCVQHDVCVSRLYWSAIDAGDRCFFIDWRERCCYYSPRAYFLIHDYCLVHPSFVLNSSGNYDLVSD